MTGISELLFGFAIIGGVTAVIVAHTIMLARKETRATSSQPDAVVDQSLRRASWS